MEILDPRHSDGDSQKRWVPPKDRDAAHAMAQTGRVHHYIPRKTSWGTPIPPPSQQSMDFTPEKGNTFEPINLDSDGETSDIPSPSKAWRNLSAAGISFDSDTSPLLNPISRFRLEDDGPKDGQDTFVAPRRPFDKWMRTLHRRATRNHDKSHSSEARRLDVKITPDKPDNFRSRHKKSSSTSSDGFVTAMRSATVSIASFSIGTRSRRTGMSRAHNWSSRSSHFGNRQSEDSAYVAGGPIDEAVIIRSVQRRKILEEIISTEENYLADVKFLKDVYVTFLTSMPTLSESMRSSISENLNEIVELHEELLGDLHKIVPYSEYSQADVPLTEPPLGSYNDRRWQSLDAVPENGSNISYLQQIPGLAADAQVAASAAKLFGQNMNRFFIYEEYGGKYELMVKDVATSAKTIPQWEIYQKGVETLGKSLASYHNQTVHSKKAMKVGDLMVKPIQRMCRYPLMFAELLKQTPVCDCPESHIQIEKVLTRLRETTAAINRATNDPQALVMMEKTWVLQDRLVFPEESQGYSKNAIRALGHVQLCGVLHVAYQTRNGVEGQHMIALLYRNFLILASAAKSEQVYTVQACIELCDIRIEESDNGRGLQCHTAPYSWKLVFEYDHQLFEIILSASTSKEEVEWRKRMNNCVDKDPMDRCEVSFFTSLSLNIKPLGTVFGKLGTITRGVSIHRATTVGPKSPLCQVIIKNTSAMNTPHTLSLTSINRSQSLLTTNRIPIIASQRTDRTRLENLMSDVWTREILPFPGMNGRSKGEHSVRSSASSLMRKLSVASIASNFTKRSGSHPSLVNLHAPNINEDFEFADITNDTFMTAFDGFEQVIPQSRSVSKSDSESTVQIQLSVVNDAHDIGNLSTENLLLTDEDRGSSLSTIKRLATSRLHKTERHREITPPLRSSSANSTLIARTSAIPPHEPIMVVFPGEKENQGQSKNRKWEKATKRVKVLSAEGLRSLFR